jgi:hypothetical protein
MSGLELDTADPAVHMWIAAVHRCRTGQGERSMSDRGTQATVGNDRSRRRQKLILLAIIAVAAIVLAAPPVLKLWMERDLCPTEVTNHGFVSKGGRWEISRADCGAGRIVHQLRIVPPKSWSVLVYEVEGGPMPVGWSQEGFVGRIELDRPLGDAATPIVEGPVRGWMSARWILVSRAGATVVLTPAVATTVGIGVVTFGKLYWDSHYAAYPWYRRWATYAPDRKSTRLNSSHRLTSRMPSSA